MQLIIIDSYNWMNIGKIQLNELCENATLNCVEELQ